ncbi:hypothetical protein RQM47_04290 [Rubrivirga sp. S365]|uniref:Uncharacterized protein n=1 Tax=Rubrivirga litoralis TaxID=3075598 RepID=A0ABU3BM27_9BACT|nr:MULTISPECIES: hypothetical protein [unclassified Rubrivirga]MDT0630341.1 hypothetical protein [Rubrivirga sp. F394]MDT7855852.1 hypothetical protein [Rubrivirga sp. S365]
MRLLPALLLLSVAGCQSTRDVPTLGGDRNPAEAVALDVTTAADLASRLDALGLDLAFVSRTEPNARASGGAAYEVAGGGELFVFEYPTAAARNADITSLAASGGADTSVYAYGERLVVVYAGADADVRATLDGALTPAPQP